eukprot:10263167-Lingulodinium_polyedra.AAC.1
MSGGRLLCCTPVLGLATAGMPALPLTHVGWILSRGKRPGRVTRSAPGQPRTRMPEEAKPT